MRFFIIPIMLLCLTGCDALPESTEIRNLSIMRMMAVDKGKDNNFKISALTHDVMDKSGGGGGKKEESSDSEEGPKPNVLSSEAPSLAVAEQGLQKLSQKKLFWGHFNYYIFGEDLAIDSIFKHLDFLSNAPDYKMSSSIYIVKGRADELINDAYESGYFLPDYLTSYLETQDLNDTAKLTLLDILEYRQKPLESIAIPMLAINEENEDIKLPNVSGYGVIKNYNLAGYLTENEAKGYNIINNETVNLITQCNINESIVNLYHTNIKSKLTPVLKDGKLQKISIDVKTECNVLEVKSNIPLNDYYSEMINQHEQEIKSYVDSTIEKVKEYKADFLKLSTLCNIKYPHKFNTDNWEEALSNLEFETNVKCNLKRSFDIREYEGRGE